MSTAALKRRNAELVRKVATGAKALERALKIGKKDRPRIAIVLGSGLGLFCERLENKTETPFEKIPHLPRSAVPGHAGKWVSGEVAGTRVLVMQGRIHGYEGHDLSVVTLPVRLIAALGITRLALTNAAGSLNPDYRPGDFMLLDDHLNCQFRSPLTGLFDERLGPRFTDMSRAYDTDLNARLAGRVKAACPEIRLHRGVYAGVTGPQYETPAEIRMLCLLGGDVVGMSTVAETIVARQCGLTVTGLSSVTNFGAGLSPATLHHEEVAAMGAKSAPAFCRLLEEWVGLAAKPLPVPPDLR